MIRRIIRGALERCLLLAPPADRAGSTLVLAYHNILPRVQNHGGDRSLHLDLEAFERQLSVIKEEADVVSLDDYSLSARTRSPRVIITFDDAYDGAIRYGVPACIAAGLPCSVFVAPALLGSIPAWDLRASANCWSSKERAAYLTRERGLGGHSQPANSTGGPAPLSHLRIADHSSILEITRSPLVRIGHHTLRHANLAALTTEESIREIRDARAWVKQHFGSAALDWLAYPYGAPPVAASRVIAETKVVGALLVNGGWGLPSNQPATGVPRWNVPSGISEAGFRLRIRGRRLQ